MLAKYTLLASIAAIALAAPSAFAGEAKYDTRQVWNGREMKTYFVAKPAAVADKPYALSGEPQSVKKSVRLETIRVGSRIVAVIPVEVR
jgi:hypothetical protein